MSYKYIFKHANIYTIYTCIIFHKLRFYYKMKFLLLLIIICFSSQTLASYSFNEELLVDNLLDSYLNFQFQFTSVWNRNLSDKSKYFNNKNLN